MTDEMLVSVVQEGDHSIITGSGIIDLTNYGEFHDSLKAASMEAGAVTVDLRRADFIDTAVIQDLARAAITLQNRGKRLTVMVDESAYPYRVLRITGFEHIMDIEAEHVEKC